MTSSLPDPKPTVGRIVHYYGPKVENLPGGAGPIAAMVTDVLESLDQCQLSLFPPLGGPLDLHAVPVDTGSVGGAGIYYTPHLVAQATVHRDEHRIGPKKWTTNWPVPDDATEIRAVVIS